MINDRLPGTPFQVKASRLFNRHALELEQVARFELAQPVEVGGNQMGDVRVAPHRPASDAQDNQLTARDLDGPRRDRGREPLGIGDHGDGITLEPQPRAVVPRPDLKPLTAPRTQSFSAGFDRRVGARDDPERRGRRQLATPDRSSAGKERSRSRPADARRPESAALTNGCRESVTSASPL